MGSFYNRRCFSRPSRGYPREADRDNTFFYTATNGLSSLTFTYEITAGGSARSRADVTLSVVDRRGTLEVQDDMFSVRSGPRNNTLDVLANDGLVHSSVSGLRIKRITRGAGFGDVRTNAAATALVYTPAADFIGFDTIEYEATDRLGGTGIGTVTVRVARVDAATDFFTLSTNGTAKVSLNVLSNDRIQPFPIDAVSNALEIISVQPASAAIGTLSIDASGTALEFLPTPGVIGQEDFYYVVQDRSGSPHTATGQVTIATVPDGTYANTDRFMVRGGGADYDLDVLANDITYNTRDKSYSIASLGTGPEAPNAGGTVTIVNNRLVYTPAPGFFGEESFTYEMSDTTFTDRALVTVSVRRGDLFASDDHFTVYRERESDGIQNIAFTLPVVLNDGIQPALGQVVQIVGIGTNNAEEVSIAADNRSLIYRPAALNNRTVFQYEISDGTDRRASATVTVDVADRAGTLDAADDHVIVGRNSTDNLIRVLANDFVLPGSAEGWEIRSLSTGTLSGTLTTNSAGFLYASATDFVGLETFTYEVNDRLGGTASATVTIQVGIIHTLPDRFNALAGSGAHLLNVLANDRLDPTYVDEYTLHSVVNLSTGGAANVISNTVHYTPDPAYIGVYPYLETFDYLISDDSSNLVSETVGVTVYDPNDSMDTSTVTVVVQGQNDPPQILHVVPNLAITDKGTATPFQGMTVIEVDEQLMEPVDILVSMNANQGSLTSVPGGFLSLGGGQYQLSNVTAGIGTTQLRQLVFVPTENRITVPETEPAYFTVSVTDLPRFNCTGVTVADTNAVVWVTATNDPPVISGTLPDQEFYQPLPIQPFSAAAIFEVDDLTLQPLDVTVTILQPSHGILQNLGLFVAISNGIYQATQVTAAEATASLRVMKFLGDLELVPVDGAQVTDFDISVDDGFAPPVLDSITSVIAVNPVGRAVQPAAINLQGAFGLDVDAIDEFSLVGAPNSSPNGINSGTAFVYRRDPGTTNTWSEWLQLQPASVDVGDRFGRSVAITEDFLAVGASHSDTGGVTVGSVYVFERDLGGADQWGERTEIFPQGLTASSRFGLSVSLDGDLLAVGAPDAFLNVGDPTPGAVFVYQRNMGGPDAWGEVFRWSPTGAGSNSGYFGWSVSLADGRLTVGAPEFDVIPGTANREGAVFMFSRDAGGAWSMDQMISSPEPAISKEFGWDVSQHPELLAVGAPMVIEGPFQRAGRVYLYEPDTNGTFVAAGKINRRSDAEERFGYSVSVKTDTILVGAPENRVPPHLGAAYLFSRDANHPAVWNMVQRFARPAGSPAGLYGTSVSFKRGTAIVGAPANLSQISNRGFTFIYRLGFNRAPVLLVDPIPDQLAEPGVPFNFSLYPDFIIDPDTDDALTMVADFPGSNNGLQFVDGVVTGTPISNGFTRINVTFSDLAGAEVLVSFKVITVSPIPFTTVRLQWYFDQFGGSLAIPGLEASLWGGNADPDLDHASNDQEYAFGGNPQALDGTGIFLEPDGAGNLLLTYTRRANDPDLSFEVECCIDIVTWVSARHIILSETAVPIDAEFERVTLLLVVEPDVPVLNYRIQTLK
jgi:hypothetical protein